MLKRKKLSGHKKSLISATIMLSVFLLAVVATTVLVLASQTQNVQSSIAITYTSKEVSGDMKLTAYSADGTNSQVLTHSNGQGEDDGYINFDISTQSTVDELNTTLRTLTSNKRYIVIECEFVNRGSRTIRVALSEILASSHNVTLTYLYNGFNKLTSSQFTNINSTSFSGQTLENTNAQSVAVAGTNRPVYFYVKIGIDSLSHNADYDATQNWLFNGDDTTIGDSLTTINIVGGNTSSITALEGLNLPVIDTDKSNYIFDGYYTSEIGGTQYVDSDGNPTRALDTSELTDNTLYARYTYALKVSGTTVSLADGIDKTKLQSLVIPASVTTMGGFAFSGCSKLQSLVIPASVTTMGTYVFSGCSNLEKVIFEDGLNLESVSVGCFQNCGKLNNVVIPDSVTSIGRHAFVNCVTLSNITLPEGLTSIDLEAFRYCSSLTSITLPSGLEYIGKRAFDNSGLIEIFIPDNVTTIDNYAFFSCTSLVSVKFGANSKLQTIAQCGFYYNINLINVIMPASVTNIGKSAFVYNYKLSKIFYQGTEGEWSNIAIESNNIPLTNATRYYYAATQPQIDGNYWHYDSDGKTPIIWE